MRSRTSVWLTTLLLTAACGEAPPDGLDGAWDAGWNQAADGLCRVPGQSVHLSGLAARADNGLLIDAIRLIGVPATVTIGEEWQRDVEARIQVEAAIGFGAEVSGPLAYRVAGSVDYADGLVLLDPGADVVRAYSVEGTVYGSLVIDDDAQIESMKVPCAALSLDEEDDWLHEEEPDFFEALAEASEDEEQEALWRVTPQRCDDESISPLDWRRHHVSRVVDLESPDEDWDDEAWEEEEREPYCVTEMTLHAEPGAGSMVTVLSGSTVTVTRLAESDGYMEVRAEFDYATLTGWLPRDDVELQRGGFGIAGWGCGGCLGCGGWGRSGGVPTYQGPAAVVPGTLVHAEADEASAWAVVRQRGPFTVRHVFGADWVQLIEIPGIAQSCRRFSQAHVPAEAVELPDRSEYR